MTRHICIIMGGPSVEHEISLRSGLEVLTHLDRGKYRVRAVVVTMAMEFYFCDPGIAPLSLPDLTDPRSSGRFTGPFSAGAAGPLWEGCDAAFLALHGTFGEDGVIQGYLDTIGIPYTGSGVFGSAIAMDKIASKFMYIGAGLSVPPYSVYGKAYPETTIDALVRRHGFPSFVKCPDRCCTPASGWSAGAAHRGTVAACRPSPGGIIDRRSGILLCHS